MVGLIAAVQQGLSDAIVSMLAFTPKVIAAFILLVIGLLAGKIVGKVVAKILDSAQVDEVLGRTPIGEMLTHSGMTILQFLDAIVRWFVYLIFIMAAVNVLEVKLFSEFLQRAVSYLPSLIAGIIILIVGFTVSDFLVGSIKSLTKTMKFQGGEHLEVGVRFFLFLVITILALDQMRIDTSIVGLFLGPLAWAFALILVFRWGVKDALSEYHKAKK